MDKDDDPKHTAINNNNILMMSAGRGLDTVIVSKGHATKYKTLSGARFSVYYQNKNVLISRAFRSQCRMHSNYFYF